MGYFPLIFLPATSFGLPILLVLTVSIGRSTSPYLAAEYFGIAHVYVAESPIGFVAQTCPSAAALEYFAFPTLFVPIAEDSDPAATVTAPAIVTVTVTVS